MATENSNNLNPDLLLLYQATLMQEQGLEVANTTAGTTSAPVHSNKIQPIFTSSEYDSRPDTVCSLQTGVQRIPTKAKVSSNEETVDLTLEEIFRDHDLHESTTTLESSMDNIGDESNSDLSGLFDDEEDDAPQAAPTRMKLGGGFATTNNLSSSDSSLRFKPFHEEKWNARLRELMQYRQVTGNCLVPHTYPPNPQLARWVKRQRRQYKLMRDGRASTMTPERLDILNQVQFVWDSHEAAWQEKLCELVEYRKVKGNCLVPSNYKKNPQLATWIKCQRRQYKLYWEGRPSAITPERILQLEKLDFEWEIRQTSQNQLGRSDFLALSDAISKMASC